MGQIGTSVQNVCLSYFQASVNFDGEPFKIGTF
jgi:hypothetical protein